MRLTLEDDQGDRLVVDAPYYRQPLAFQVVFADCEKGKTHNLTLEFLDDALEEISQSSSPASRIRESGE